jgi:FkbM family methyltransferase
MKPLDFDWLKQQADDEQSVEYLQKIEQWRNHTLKYNEFIADDTEFNMRLCGYVIHCKVSSAFSAVETFSEIFNHAGHMRLREFIPQNGQTILDIGANQGFYTMRAKYYAPQSRILAFEPNPCEYAMLQKNIAGNNLDGVEAVRRAVGVESSEITMEIVPQIGPIGGRSVRIPERKWMKDEFVKTISVQSVSLDEILETYNIGSVDILKMDVEGMELDILSHFHRFACVERIVLEYHSMQIKQNVKTLLERQGFTMALDVFDPGDYYGDMYFVRNN